MDYKALEFFGKQLERIADSMEKMAREQKRTADILEANQKANSKPKKTAFVNEERW